jgi:hypothetical protein
VDVSIYATNRKKLSPGRQLPKPRILDSSDSEDSEAEEKKSLIDTPRTRKYHFINIYCIPDTDAILVRHNSNC